jgi:hypothetical protein
MSRIDALRARLVVLRQQREEYRTLERRADEICRDAQRALYECELERHAIQRAGLDISAEVDAAWHELQRVSMGASCN